MKIAHIRVDENQISYQDQARIALVGNLMTAATKQLRTMDVAWHQMPKSKQETLLEQIREDVNEAVWDAVHLIVSEGRTRFRASVEQVVFKEGVKAVLTMGNTEASHELADQAGGSVLVVIEDANRYTSGADGHPSADEDQRPLL
jgi:hypothetical protein